MKGTISEDMKETIFERLGIKIKKYVIHQDVKNLLYISNMLKGCVLSYV